MPLSTSSVPHLGSADAHRNKFRTPFWECRCPSELAPTVGFYVKYGYMIVLLLPFQAI